MKTKWKLGDVFLVGFFIFVVTIGILGNYFMDKTNTNSNLRRSDNFRGSSDFESDVRSYCYQLEGGVYGQNWECQVKIREKWSKD